MKVRSLTELQEKLDSDLVWRKREFTTLKFLVTSSREHEKLILLRASIALLYAHWEGHIKHCASVYLSYLNHISPKYGQMTDNFLQMSLSEKFKKGFSIKSFSSQKEICEYIMNCRERSFLVNADVIINTESNLKYEVVFNILNQLGLDKSTFELKENFIDSKLVRFRNSIAHGDNVNKCDLYDTYQELDNELLEMIQLFKNLVLSAAENQLYLKC